MPLRFMIKGWGRLSLACALFPLAIAAAGAGEKIGGFGDTPALKSPGQSVRKANSPSDSGKPDADVSAQLDDGETAPVREPRGRTRTKPGSWRRAFLAPEKPVEPEETREEMPGEIASGDQSPPAIPEAAPPPAEPESPPTPECVELYRARLEARLLERYNNLPDYAGRVGRVTVILSRPIEYSLDNRFIRAEFDQIVLDIWSKRLPTLEKEYFVVTFGSGGAETVRSDPGIRIGLDLEKTYSERAPLTADPFRSGDGGEAFGAAPAVKMPEWWRPEFKDID